MRALYKILSAIICAIVMMSVIVVFILCFLTPEKTKHGTYTDLYKYWTDDAYLCSNFSCKANKGE